MDFARRELEKYGWKEGNGLGKNSNGICESLKPKLKFDNKGIGFSAADEFSPWWEHVYNEAANSVGDVKGKTGKKKKTGNSDKVLGKFHVHKQGRLPPIVFCKGNTIQEDEIILHAPKDDSSIKTGLSDEELLRKCGGCTAHKAARHGITSKGKLGRLQKQEQLILKKLSYKKLCNKINLKKSILIKKK